MSGKLKAHMAVLSANILFGINYSAVEYITKKSVHSFALNTLRVGITTAILWLLMLVYRETPLIRRRHLPRFILCALTGVVINQSFSVKGQSLTLSIHASLLSLVTPIFITFIAAWFLKEKFTLSKFSGLALGIGGALMLILHKERSGSGENIIRGDIFIIINAISYAVYFILVKPLMKEYTPLQILRWVFTLGLPLILLLGWKEMEAVRWQALPPFNYWLLAYIVIGATLLAYVLNLYSIAHIGASLSGAYIYTQPVFAAIMAMVVLHEALTVYKVMAALTIAAGVFLVNRPAAEPVPGDA